MNQTILLTFALTIFLAPVLSFAVLALAHHRLPRHGDYLGIGAMGLGFILSLVLFISAWFNPSTLMMTVSFDWMPTGIGRALRGGLMIDRLTCVMLVVVTLISCLVHIFSTAYMEGDKRYGRYYAGLSIFSASMLGLVMANNLLYLYIFWELVGLSSYLLIGHFFEKKSAADAAKKAFVTTRIGDVGMFIGIMIVYRQVGSLQYADLFAAVQQGVLTGNLRTIAGVGLFLGAMGKSAQFPLHVWLPDAMEGPTPVSALIHAATMVAAGVYLVGRLMPLFDEGTLLFIAYIGGITALFAATIALVQDDIKKVQAYSTVSQLGYMIMALGVGGYVAGLFHLTTHAFFKACLFLGSGAVIHAMHHEQSMSQYGGLRHKMPYTFLCYLVATLALAGFPLTSGFFSKDMILADTLHFSMQHGHWFLPVAGFTTALLTAFYMTRQVCLTFLGKPRNQKKFDHAHEVGRPMLVPLMVLGTLALVSGWFGWFGHFVPQQSAVEQVSLHAALGHTGPMIDAVLAEAAGAAGHEAAHVEEHHGFWSAHNIAMALSIVLALGGIALGLVVYYERRDGTTIVSAAKLKRYLLPIWTLLWNKYYFDEMYNVAVVGTFKIVAVICAFFDRQVIDRIVGLAATVTRGLSLVVDRLDRKVVDGTVNGSAWSSGYIGGRLAFSQTGRVRQYLLFMVLGMLAVAFAILWIA